MPMVTLPCSEKAPWRSHRRRSWKPTTKWGSCGPTTAPWRWGKPWDAPARTGFFFNDWMISSLMLPNVTECYLMLPKVTYSKMGFALWLNMFLFFLLMVHWDPWSSISLIETGDFPCWITWGSWIEPKVCAQMWKLCWPGGTLHDFLWRHFSQDVRIWTNLSQQISTDVHHVRQGYPPIWHGRYPLVMSNIAIENGYL